MTRLRIEHFLAFSLLLHGGGFLAWAAVAPVRTVSSMPVIVPLRLALQPPAQEDRSVSLRESPAAAGARDTGRSAAVSSRRNTPARSADAVVSVFPREDDVSVSAARPATRAGTDVESAPVFLPPPRDPAPAAPGAETRIIAQLRDAVETHFYYPPLARRRGWEGEVMVSLRVEIDGRLTGIRVVRSSGYRSLDSAAVDCLRQAARLPVPGRLLETGLDLVLPVRYLLINTPA